MKSIQASLGLCLQGVDVCGWSRVCPGVSPWPASGEATSPVSLHPDSVQGGRGGWGRTHWIWKERRGPAWSGDHGTLMSPALPRGGEELGRMERMKGSGGNGVTRQVPWESGRMQLLGLEVFCHFVWLSMGHPVCPHFWV